MRPVDLSRITVGAVVIVGLLLWTPLAYLAGGMMVFAGLTRTCLLERLFGRFMRSDISCALPGQGASPRSLSRMSAEEIKQAVSEKYSAVALTPRAKFNFPVGRRFAESVGYPKEILDRLPASMWESFTGAGNPQPYVDAKPGETVLDLGCGAGLDMYFYSKAVGDGGNVYGLDLSSAMLEKARCNLQSTGLSNAELFCAPADSIPLPDASVDLVTANGIYNLSPGKDAVMREVYRVLQPGGRTVFAEIVLKAPLPQEVRKNIDDWFRCIGGALTQEEFLSRMSAAGFRNPNILWSGRNARTGHKLALCAIIRAEK